MRSFRNLSKGFTEGLQVTSFDSNSKEVFHFVKKEHSGPVSYACFDSQAEELLQRCYEGSQGASRTEAGVTVLTLADALFPRAVSFLLEAHICVKIWRKIPDPESRYRWVLDSVVTPGDTTAVRGMESLSIAALNILWSGRALSIGICFSAFPIVAFELEAGTVAAQMAE